MCDCSLESHGGKGSGTYLWGGAVDLDTDKVRLAEVRLGVAVPLLGIWSSSLFLSLIVHWAGCASLRKRCVADWIRR